LPVPKSTPIVKISRWLSPRSLEVEKMTPDENRGTKVKIDGNVHYNWKNVTKTAFHSDFNGQNGKVKIHET